MTWQQHPQRRRSLLACSLCLAAWLLPAALPAQDETTEEDTAWKAERDKLTAVIDQRVKEEVDKTVKPQDVATKLGMKWPVPKPKQTKEQIEADVNRQIDELTAKQFPESRRKAFEKEAAEKYKIFQTGDEVSFNIRGGMGPNAIVRGRLLDRTAQRVKVSSRFILREDIAEEDQARFWEDVSEEYRKRYIRVQNAQYDGKIRAFQDAQRQTRLPAALRAARYAAVPNKPKSLKLSDWFAEADVLDFFCKKLAKECEERERPRIAEQVFTSNGYEMVEDTINNTKEWMPKKQAVSFRARLQELLDKKKQEEEAAKAAKAAPADPWGAEPAMGPGPGMEPGMDPAGAMPPAPGPEPGMPPPPAAPNPFDNNQ
ncbi:MAG: hypothetical protein GX595_16465 [Lentisphaerae bacterium]|nr:hypothetical protein [Lentisphaerota bacterium]